jgi:ABC-type proline/glycine betaine transport system substrate-binding protein
MKIKNTFLSLVIVLLFCLINATGSASAEGNKKITIAYSSNVEGYLEPCG